MTFFVDDIMKVLWGNVTSIFVIIFFFYVKYSKFFKNYFNNYFLQDKDQYGNEVQKLARPLPVEYLLVDVPVSTPLQQIYTFPASVHNFPVENRMMAGHLQDFSSLNSYMYNFRSDDFLRVNIWN